MAGTLKTTKIMTICK